MTKIIRSLCELFTSDIPDNECERVFQDMGKLASNTAARVYAGAGSIACAVNNAAAYATNGPFKRFAKQTGLLAVYKHGSGPVIGLIGTIKNIDDYVGSKIDPKITRVAQKTDKWLRPKLTKLYQYGW